MTTAHVPTERFSGNRRTLVILATVVTFMVGMAYASVPLYKLFCQVTGYGGTTQVSADAATHVVSNHPVTVRFDANINRGLAWKFEPVDRPVTVKPGEEVVINYQGNKYWLSGIDRHIDIQCDAAKSWRLFHEDRLFLLSGANPAARRIGVDAGTFFRRSRYCS
jgi:hypothetical protein